MYPANKYGSTFLFVSYKPRIILRYVPLLISFLIFILGERYFLYFSNSSLVEIIIFAHPSKDILYFIEQIFNYLIKILIFILTPHILFKFLFAINMTWFILKAARINSLHKWWSCWRTWTAATELLFGLNIGTALRRPKG